MQLQLHNFFTLCLTLIITVESLRHHHGNDQSHKLYDNGNENESENKENSDQISENDHHEDMNSNDSNHVHNGLARWGEENPYQQDSDDDEKHTTTEEEHNAEEEEEGEKGKDKETKRAENYNEQAYTQQAANNSLDHQHEGIANWGNRQPEHDDDGDTAILNGADDNTQESDGNKTLYNETHKHANTTNHSKIWSNPVQINQSSPHDPENYNHDHDNNHNDGNSTDSSHDSQIIDHLVDPLLSNMYVTDNQSSIVMKTHNDTDDLTAERSCRKCIKWQQLQLTLPCLLYPINVDAPEDVNKTKIIYVHVMRKVIARINRSLNELLSDMELY
ncbi:hypothetical protein EWB00_000048 [Schistosoma japonicum]|uniref:Uncharacterized protein n=1 Tax=Schistosoma japonicum TaxID=6182 RepID=A0A4Z2DK74_SCHJA|nr:hypothetical protein KSF78_0003756 [Schistosoma japonicum]TNN16903.1 hypothetical protein EWB00_000048 [Schistosoma japonicum]